ncbi:MAG TPA: anthranilate phosphoribosyltransferase [Acidimicrobiales bacterium]|nr:anthranilate phosphoribosyltransferase [Acidimicrobiales bacterium]
MGEQPPSLETPTLEMIGGWRAVLGALTAGEDLTKEQARAGMAEILEGAATPAQIAGFAIALRMKGETVEELDGLLDAMLDVAAKVEVAPGVADRLVDVVGTGGDRSHTINVSTLSALVVAGAGVPVCKHGNRAASSSCGAADLLEALGVAIEIGADAVARCIAEAGIGFCFAPRFHPALRHAGPARRELAVPTAFNFLGPLANPARVRRQLVGVSDPSMADRMLGVLAARGSRHVLLVHGHDGLDELTTTTTSTVHELDAGEVRTWVLDPADVGLPRAEPEDLRGGDPATNAAIARAVLAGASGPPRDVVLLNAGAALVAAGSAAAVEDGIGLAATSIDSGNAAAALDRLVAVSNAAA